jgi:hypothetical protein
MLVMAKVRIIPNLCYNYSVRFVTKPKLDLVATMANFSKTVIVMWGHMSVILKFRNISIMDLCVD